MEFRFLSLGLGVLGEGSTRICLGGHLWKLIGTAFTTVESDPCLSLVGLIIEQLGVKFRAHRRAKRILRFI